MWAEYPALLARRLATCSGYSARVVNRPNGNEDQKDMWAFIWRNRRVITPTRRFREAIAAASGEAGSAGADSLDILVAITASGRGATLIAGLGDQAEAVQAAARRGRTMRRGGPGFTDDARIVIEAASARALRHHRRPEVDDLLISLTTAECLAQSVLAERGILPSSFSDPSGANDEE